MSPELFQRWLLEMRIAGLANSDADCGHLLGISANAIVNLKKRGSDKRTALACRALLDGLKPYGD